MAEIIKINEGDLLNDNPHELTLLVGYEMASLISAMMIRPILEVLGTKEQINYWMPLLKTFRSIGCYAQTELGHGSDV